MKMMEDHKASDRQLNVSSTSLSDIQISLPPHSLPPSPPSLTHSLPPSLSSSLPPSLPPSLTPSASLLVRLKEVQVDLYLDQPAGSGRHHWNKANDLILRNVRYACSLHHTSIHLYGDISV